MSKLTWLALIAPGLALVACLSSAARDPAAGAAAAQLAQIDRARVAWQTTAGPRQAVDYARAVHEALAAGAYRVDPHRWGVDLPDSIRALDQAAARAGGDEAHLVAWRGLLLADNAQPDDAAREFARSLALGPTALAAAGLATHHGRRGELAQLHAVCGEAAPRLVDGERFDLMVRCAEASNALSEEAGLPWASPDDLAWFRAERERRAQLAAAQAQAERAREREDLAARRDQMMVGQMCRDACAEELDRCYARCGNVARDACATGCQHRERVCREDCD